MTDSIQITRPDDWHAHFRDGEAMASIAAATAKQFARAIVMPNLKPPVVDVKKARGVSRAHPRGAAEARFLRAADDALPHRRHQGRRDREGEGRPDS
jgi:hypothetical protein